MTLKGQSQGHSDFEPLYLAKGEELDHILVLNKSAENSHLSYKCRYQAERQGLWAPCLSLRYR